MDLKYGQTVKQAGEYECSNCGHVHIYRGEDVVEPCLACGGHFYYARFHRRR